MDIIITRQDRLEAKLARLPEAVKASQLDVNNQCALDFMQRVLSIIPRGGPDPGRLAGTLVKEPGTKSPLAVQVAVGGPAAPYPAHLEFGHMAHGDTHVPAEPFWFTTLRLNRKRYKAMRTKAGTKALKAVATAG